MVLDRISYVDECTVCHTEVNTSTYWYSMLYQWESCKQSFTEVGFYAYVNDTHLFFVTVRLMIYIIITYLLCTSKFLFSRGYKKVSRTGIKSNGMRGHVYYQIIILLFDLKKRLPFPNGKRKKKHNMDILKQES